MSVKASVIIPTRNRAELLGLCLESLCGQSLDKGEFEVIVVDNGSSDTTRQTVERYSHNLKLIYIYEEVPGLHIGRHAGLRKSNSNILIFGDDDIVALPTWIESIVSAFECESVVMVGGNNYPRFESEPPKWLKSLWNRAVGHGRALGALSIIDFGIGRFAVNPNFIWGCNFSIRKEALLQAGGFHPDSMPKSMLKYRGDGESHVSRFVAKNNDIAMFDSDASVFHFVADDRMTETYFCKRYFAQGVSDSYSEIRAANGSPGWGGYARNRLKAWRWVVSNRIRSLLVIGQREESTLCQIQRRAFASYWQGFKFHRNCIAKDPELKDWVLRENYFEPQNQRNRCDTGMT